jgi:hypothetical protein
MEAREGPFRLGVQSRGFRRGSAFSTGKTASFAVRKAGIAPLLLKEELDADDPLSLVLSQRAEKKSSGRRWPRGAAGSSNCSMPLS